MFSRIRFVLMAFFAYEGDVLCVASHGHIYTLYPGIRSWNEVQDACSSSGFSMLKIESGRDSVEFLKLVQRWMKNGKLNYDMWMGLYDKKQRDHDEVKYQWQDCRALGSFRPWSSSEPDDKDTDHCVRLSTSGTFKTSSCSVQYHTVCQQDVKCWFKKRDADVSKYIKITTNFTQSKCKRDCQLRDGEDNACVAFKHSSGTCHTYLRSPPGPPPVTSPYRTTVSVKRCHRGYFNSTHPPAAENKDEFAIDACDADTTTSSSTTTPPPSVASTTETSALSSDTTTVVSSSASTSTATASTFPTTSAAITVSVTTAVTSPTAPTTIAPTTTTTFLTAAATVTVDTNTAGVTTNVATTIISAATTTESATTTSGASTTASATTTAGATTISAATTTANATTTAGFTTTTDVVTALVAAGASTTPTTTTAIAATTTDATTVTTPTTSRSITTPGADNVDVIELVLSPLHHCHVTGMCHEVCIKVRGLYTLDMMTLLKHLLLEKNILSSYRRSKISIPDYRPSAVSIGMVGICILVGFVVTIVLMDVVKYASWT